MLVELGKEGKETKKSAIMVSEREKETESMCKCGGIMKHATARRKGRGSMNQRKL